MKRLLLGLMISGRALADPCGMVPPLSLPDGEGPPIERVGEQRTYVFYKEGVETLVIHPGFKGRVDQFGMLIPFPDPPALRKMPDNTFEQLENAVTPPEINFWVRYPRGEMDDLRPSARAAEGLSLESKDEVRVLKQEAVGMYEVAVLEAGSSSALKRWMDQHGYRFPDGMDATCDDYVRLKWCFVAVKTRVGSKAGVDPRPGMRNPDPQKPPDSTFSGHVQAMGFRFKSKELVVPMRLSAFNAGPLNNKIYLLAPRPMRIKNLSADFVKKQIPGEKLYRNLTGPLPYRLQGGTEDDMSPNDWKRLNAQRDAEPYNGVAAELFATDLLAVRQGQLTHEFEEKEKQMLDIGERLGLRGGDLDSLQNQALDEDRKAIKKAALSDVKSMTLTVIEGDFPRDVLGRENLEFAPFELGHRGPATSESQSPPGGWLPASLLLGVGGLLAWQLRRSEWLLAGLMLLPVAARAQDSWRTARGWIDLLDVPERSAEARQEILHRGNPVAELLLEQAENAQAPLIRRGYCLALLVEMQPPSDAAERLQKLASHDAQPLVRRWASAARVKLASDPAQLMERLKSTSGGVAAMERPAALRLQEWSSQLTLEQAMAFATLVPSSASSPSLAEVAAPIIRRAGPSELARLMFTSKDVSVRQTSAGLLSGLAQKDRAAVMAQLLHYLADNPQAKEVPWGGGALFLPQMNFQKGEARSLIGALVGWYQWAGRHDAGPAVTQPLENNLRSYNLWQAAGGENLGWRNAQGAAQWAQLYRQLDGQH